jgi:hypothetical protein
MKNMAEIIYLKDVLFIKPKAKVEGKKAGSRLRMKSERPKRVLKSSLLERKKEDIKGN